jgi:phosphoribosylamine--glycine ligase
MLIFVTRDYSSLGIAALAASQGSDVLLAFIGKEKPIGEGLVDKIPVEDALRKHVGSGHLWIFDGNFASSQADRLRDLGELVLGTTTLSDTLEHDREFAASVASKVGIAVPPTEEFSSYKDAMAFVERSQRAYVYKANAGDPTSTFVPQSASTDGARAELLEYLRYLSSRRQSGSFVLQEIVDGIEAAFDIWVRDGKPLVAFCDIESKRKYNGDLGPMTGCAGGIVFKIPLDSMAAELPQRYLKLKETATYTGSIDLSVRIAKGIPYFLENCWRFAYSAYPAMLTRLARRPVEETLQEWVTGGSVSMDGMFKSGFAASVAVSVDSPGFAIVPEFAMRQVHPYSLAKLSGHLEVVEKGDMLVTTGYGTTPEGAMAEALFLAEQVQAPGKVYRTDLSSSELPTSPVWRFRALSVAGWFSKHQPEDDEKSNPYRYPERLSVR